MKITRSEVQKRLMPVDPASHKGTLGHALIIGGSYGKIGAVCLSSKAALKTGCGLVTAFFARMRLFDHTIIHSGSHGDNRRE